MLLFMREVKESSHREPSCGIDAYDSIADNSIDSSY